MSLPILYGLSRSVYTRIARLALEEKGVDYAFEEVEIFGGAGVPERHLDRHPFGRIPTFTQGEGGFSLYETVAITRYVDEAFPGPPLQPTTPEARARMTQVIKRVGRLRIPTHGLGCLRPARGDPAERWNIKRIDHQ